MVLFDPALQGVVSRTCRRVAAKQDSVNDVGRVVSEGRRREVKVTELVVEALKVVNAEPDDVQTLVGVVVVAWPRAQQAVESGGLEWVPPRDRRGRRRLAQLGDGRRGCTGAGGGVRRGRSRARDTALESIGRRSRARDTALESIGRRSRARDTALESIGRQSRARDTALESIGRRSWARDLGTVQQSLSTSVYDAVG